MLFHNKLWLYLFYSDLLCTFLEFQRASNQSNNVPSTSRDRQQSQPPVSSPERGKYYVVHSRA